jgi:hypothetical protein
MENTPTHGRQDDGPAAPPPWQQDGHPAPVAPPPASQPYPAQPYPAQPYPAQPATGPTPSPDAAAPAGSAHGQPPAEPPAAGFSAAWTPFPSAPTPLYFPPSDSGRRRRRRRRWISVLVAAVALLTLGGAVVSWRLLGSDKGPTRAPGAATTQAPGPATTQASDPATTRASDAATTPRQSSQGSSPVPDPNGDEFDGPLDDRWGVYGSTSPNGSVWAKDAVAVQDGLLRITGTGRNPTGSGNMAGGVCWCGAGGNRTSGVWTVRARFDAGAGYGPELLLWPQSDKATDGFALFAAANEANRTTVRSLVTGGAAGGRAEATRTGDFTQWHVYKVEWRAGSLRMFVDDQVLFDSASRPDLVVPTAPMHLVIQVMVGPKDGVPAANASTPDKVVTEVDWVRYTP